MSGGRREGNGWREGVYLFPKAGILVEVSGEDNNRILSAFPGAF